MAGFIQLHRKLLEWEWYHDINTFKLFIHLLLKANYAEKQWQGKTIKRGQLVTSIKQLSMETGLSDKQVRTSIDKLILTKEVGKQTTSVNTTLTILNYNLYQSEGKPTDKQGANEKSLILLGSEELIQNIDNQQGKQTASEKPTESTHIDEIETNKGKPMASEKANEGQTKGKPRATTNKENKENKEKKENNIEERKLKFASTLKPFLETYGKAMIIDFYKYWVEPNKSNTKFKQELEMTWDVTRRLAKWAENDSKFNKGKKPNVEKWSDPSEVYLCTDWIQKIPQPPSPSDLEACQAFSDKWKISHLRTFQYEQQGWSNVIHDYEP